MASFVPLAIGLGTQLAGKVGMSFLSNLFGGHSAQQSAMASFNASKKYYDYTRKKNLADQISLMRKDRDIQKQLMSNSAKATQALNQNLMDYQYALERDSRQSAYADTRLDLEKAGYNPLLAVGQQSGYTSVGSGVSAQSEGLENSQIANSAMDIMEKFSNMRNAARGLDLNEATLEQNALNSKFTNDLTSAKAEHERSMTRGQDISNGVDDVFKMLQARATLDMTNKQTEQLDNLISTTIKRLDNETRETNSRINLNSAKTVEANESARYYRDRSRGNVTSEGADKGSFGMNIGPFGFKVSPGNYKYNVVR